MRTFEVKLTIELETTNSYINDALLGVSGDAIREYIRSRDLDGCVRMGEAKEIA